MARWIKTDFTVVDFDLAESVEERLKQFQQRVGGDIEAVYLPTKKRLMFINEEGKINKLPLNMVATEYARESLIPRDVIVGDAVLLTVEETRAERDAE